MIYTVTTQRFKIRFIDPATHEVNTYAEERRFNDPGEACGEFAAYAGRRGAEYVTPATFAKKVAALKKLHARMAEWTAATQQQSA